MVEQSRSATLNRRFIGDGHYDLCLRIDELIQLQEKLGIGPFALANRLIAGEWFVGDVRETIRLGLIGAGLAPKRAYDLIEGYVKEAYLIEYAALAGELAFAAISGVEDEPLGEAEAPTMTETETDAI